MNCEMGTAVWLLNIGRRRASVVVPFLNVRLTVASPESGCLTSSATAEA